MTSAGKAALKLMFATMIRAAERWCRVLVRDLERHQLRLLRAELGLGPPPAATEPKTRPQGSRRMIYSHRFLPGARDLTSRTSTGETCSAVVTRGALP